MFVPNYKIEKIDFLFLKLSKYISTITTIKKCPTTWNFDKITKVFVHVL